MVSDEWLWNVVTCFDFGSAFRVETSVNNLIGGKFLYTFVLVLEAMPFLTVPESDRPSHLPLTLASSCQCHGIDSRSWSRN